MANNLFLTGYKGVGKTTIIKKAVNEFDLAPAGFMTVRDEDSKGNWTRFYLVPANACITNDNVNPPSNNVFASRASKSDDIKINTNLFDQVGVKLLKGDSDLVIMDELGRFESEAHQFQEKVEEVLESSVPVLGVMKDESIPFLNNLRKEYVPKVLRVTKDNRENIYKFVHNWLKNLNN